MIISLIQVYLNNLYLLFIKEMEDFMNNGKLFLISHCWSYKSGIRPTLIKLKALSKYIKLMGYSTHCQLVLGWNLI